MEKTVRIAVDAMGGDNAPGEIVKGAVLAANENENISLTLVGQADKISGILKDLSYDAARVKVENANEIIETGEPPVMAIREKRDSSLVKAMYLVKDGECDAFVSAGSTGAVLAGGQVIIGRIKGVQRAPLAPLIPTEKGVSLLIDCGANVDARPAWLIQFAQMGSIYMDKIMNVKNPRVALVNIGAEEDKGNQLVRETYPLLKNSPDINFIGNIEARDISAGAADVIVCDAFVGNVILKMYEGVAKSLRRVVKKSMTSSLKTKIGALLIQDALKTSLADYDMNRYGGAPMLGLNALAVKAHGSSEAGTFKNACLQCVDFYRTDIKGIIKEKIEGEV